MGHRNTILAVGEIYHIFNRSTHEIPIFRTSRDYEIFTEAMIYYLQKSPRVKFSFYRRQKSLYPIKFNTKLVTVLNYCLMPNHYHFTLRQEEESGIKHFIQRLSGSYAHYFNKKYDTTGALFSGNFKAVRIEDERQLLHLSRYIHLNPVTSYLVDRPEDYNYSSYKAYLKKSKSDIIDPTPILDLLGKQDYEKFVLDRKDYQRELSRIKHIILD